MPESPFLYRLQWLLRYLVFLLFSLWWGGLVFYAAAVVPLGGWLIGVTEQGAITAYVTLALNGLGSLLLLAMLAEHQLGSALNPARGWQVKFWWVAVLVQLGLWILAAILHRQFDPQELKIQDTAVFYFWHRLYLWLSIIQMLYGLSLLKVAADRFGSPMSRS